MRMELYRGMSEQWRYEFSGTKKECFAQLRRHFGMFPNRRIYKDIRRTAATKGLPKQAAYYKIVGYKGSYLVIQWDE